MNHYGGVPNKKRKVYADRGGNLYPLDFKLEVGDQMVACASGVINSSGDVTITGTVFKPDSVIVATYNSSAVGTSPIAVEVISNSASFYGDADTAFYYTVFNQK